MAARVGINRFGRTGCLAFRAAWGWPELEFVHVNEWGSANRLVELARVVALSLPVAAGSRGGDG